MRGDSSTPLALISPVLLAGAGSLPGRSEPRWTPLGERPSRVWSVLLIGAGFCAAVRCPARGGRPGLWCRCGRRGCVTAGGWAGGGCGVTAVRAAARAGALSRWRQRAKLSRQLRRDSPATPAVYGAALPDRSTHPLVLPALAARVRPGPDSPARRRRALEAVVKVLTDNGCPRVSTCVCPRVCVQVCAVQVVSRCVRLRLIDDSLTWHTTRLGTAARLRLI